MDWTADHAGFVVAAYAIVFVVLAGVVLRSLLKAQELRRALLLMKLPDVGVREKP
jgi:heme exporter protein CcmD